MEGSRASTTKQEQQHQKEDLEHPQSTQQPQAPAAAAPAAADQAARCEASASAPTTSGAEPKPVAAKERPKATMMLKGNKPIVQLRKVAPAGGVAKKKKPAVAATATAGASPCCYA